MLIAIFITNRTTIGDFQLYYRAACIILDPSVANSLVYSSLNFDKYAIPWLNTAGFPYSMAAAYILAPLAFLPYFWAKTTFIFIDLIAYLVAVGLLLRNLGAAKRWFFYPIALSLLWFPFFMDVINGQINSILFLLVVLATFATTKNKPVLAGILIGLAALFKLFPLAIALVLGIKNWRIWVACAATFAVSFLIPGSTLWLASISHLPSQAYTPAHQYFSRFGLYWFWVYSAAIGAITAITAWRARHIEFIYLASLAIPGAFLAAPIVEIYHLVFLMLPYLYLFAAMQKDKFGIIILSLSAFAIYFVMYCLWTIDPIQYAGLVLLWIVAIVQVNRSIRNMSGCTIEASIVAKTE